MFFFSHRIKAQKQQFSQLFPITRETEKVQMIFDATTPTKHWEENVAKMRSIIKEHDLFRTSCSVYNNRGLINVFTGIKATSGQTHDLLDARKLGQCDYIHYITHHLLQTPSVANPPVRRRRLLTMAPLKSKKKGISQKEKEERDVNKYLRRRLAWCNQTGITYDASQEQYSLIPRALADLDGNPHKGNKSIWTTKLQSCYNLPECTPFVSGLDSVPEVVILDAMFSININPLRQRKSIEQYSHLLLRQFALPYYNRGTNEVHLVFDHPGRLMFNPKDCEHKRRYNQGNKEHTHISFTPHSNS